MQLTQGNRNHPSDLLSWRGEQAHTGASLHSTAALQVHRGQGQGGFKFNMQRPHMGLGPWGLEALRKYSPLVDQTEL